MSRTSRCEKKLKLPVSEMVTMYSKGSNQKLRVKFLEDFLKGKREQDKSKLQKYKEFSKE